LYWVIMPIYKGVRNPPASKSPISKSLYPKYHLMSTLLPNIYIQICTISLICQVLFYIKTYPICGKIIRYRNVFYKKLSTIWGNLSTDRNVFILGVYLLLGRIVSRDLLSTLASPALRGYLKSDRNTKYLYKNNPIYKYHIGGYP